VIRRAAWVGCSLSVIQQLTGMNAIMFYSSFIFSNTPLGANQASALIQSVNLAGVVVATGLLDKFGRRSLMFSATGACTVFMFLVAIFTFTGNLWLELVFVLAYVASFEFGPGPVVWMYMSEIMNDKGVSIGTLLNWTFTLIIGLITPIMFNSMKGGWPFIVFGILCGLGTVFVFFFMKETKGLSDAEVKKLYRTDRDIIGEFE
jgi:MFS family permease